MIQIKRIEDDISSVAFIAFALTDIYGQDFMSNFENMNGVIVSSAFAIVWMRRGSTLPSCSIAFSGASFR